MAEHFALLAWWEPVDLTAGIPRSPQEAAALYDLGLELGQASLGNRTLNLRRAIACCEAALRVRTEQDFPQDWATTQNNLGIAWSNLPTGDRGENLYHAITCRELFA